MPKPNAISETGSRCVEADNGHRTEADRDKSSPSKTMNGEPAHPNVSKRPPSSNTKSRNASRKRPRGDLSGDRVHEEDGGYWKRPPRPKSRETRLACPFFKHDPAKYCGLRTCQTPGWTSVVRLKEHIKRNHEKEMTEWQIKRLRSRARYSSKSDEERWLEIYNILFPEAETQPTPYCFEPSDNPQSFGSHLNHEVLRLLRERLAEDSMFEDASPMLMQRIPEIVSECMASAMINYQHPQLSAPAMPTGNETFTPLDYSYQILPAEPAAIQPTVSSHIEQFPGAGCYEHFTKSPMPEEEFTRWLSDWTVEVEADDRVKTMSSWLDPP